MSDLAVAKPSVLALVLAVLLPPVGVWIARGIGFSFWISLVLTLIGWVPGVVFSLVAILRPDLVERARA